MLFDFDDDEENMLSGFLVAVHFLHPVPLYVQVELLGEACELRGEIIFTLRADDDWQPSRIIRDPNN